MSASDHTYIMKIVAVTFALVVLAAGAEKRCDKWIASTDAFVRAVSVEEATSWRQMDDECSHQYRGFRLLHTRHSTVGDAERRVCGDNLVPLGVKKIKDNFFWVSRGMTGMETVSDADRNYMLLNVEGGDVGDVGALNLTSGFWHLVSEDHLFQCALCQMREEDEVIANSTLVNGQINRTNIDNLQALAHVASLQFKMEIRNTMFAIRSNNITNITDFLQKHPGHLTNITAKYENALKSQVNLLTEGSQLLQTLSETQMSVSQLDDVTSIASDLIGMNNDTLLNFNSNLYNQTLQMYKVVEMLTILKRILKGDDNFLWSYKQITQKIIKSLEKIAANLQLGDKDFTTSVSQNAILIVADVYDKSDPIIGFSLTDQKHLFSLNTIRQKMDNSKKQSSFSYKFFFPSNVVEARVAAVVLVYKDLVFPKKTVHDDTVGYLTPVVHLVVADNKTSPEDLVVDVLFNSENSKNHKSISKYVTRQCSVWNSEKSAWTTDGCQLINSSTGSLDKCRCIHAFVKQCESITTVQYIVEDWNDYAAFLSNNRIPIYKSRKNALGFISLIGYSFTLFGIVGIFLTYVSFKAWNVELENTALVHLCLAVLLNIALLLVATFVPVPGVGVACIAVGAGIHYSIIACFTWVLNMSGLQLLAITNDLKKFHGSALACLLSFGWGIPLIPIATLLSWEPEFYTPLPNNGTLLETGGPSFIAAVQALHTSVMTLVGVKHKFLEESVNKEVCYPTGFALHAGERIPVGALLTFNALVVFLTFCRLIIYKKKSYSTEVVRKLVSHLLVLFMLGIPWGFSFIAFIDVNEVFAYVFSIVVTTLGLSLFILFVVLDDKALACWGSLCRRDKSYVINFNEPATMQRYRGESGRDFSRGNFYEFGEDIDSINTSGSPGQSFEMSTETFALDKPDKPLTKNMIIED